MPNIFDILDHRLAHFHTHIGGVVCFIITVLCFFMIREFHKIGKCLCPKDGDEGLSINGYFALNASLFLFGTVMSLKGIERIAFSDSVTVLDLIRDTTILFIWVTWAVLVKRRRLEACKNK